MKKIVALLMLIALFLPASVCSLAEEQTDNSTLYRIIMQRTDTIVTTELVKCANVNSDNFYVQTITDTATGEAARFITIESAKLHGFFFPEEIEQVITALEYMKTHYSEFQTIRSKTSSGTEIYTYHMYDGTDYICFKVVESTKFTIDQTDDVINALKTCLQATNK